MGAANAGPGFYYETLKEALPQLRDIGCEGLRQSGQWAKKHKLAAAFLAAGTSAGITAGFMYLGPAMMGIQALGVVGNMVGIAANRMRLNRHTRSIVPLNAPVILTHIALLHAWSGLLMGSFGTARALTLSMMPDDDEKWRKTRMRVAFGFAAVGLPAMAVFSYYTSWWGLLNMGAMCGGITSDLVASSRDKTKDNSRYARLARVESNSLNLLYDVLHSGSISGMAFGALSLNNTRTVIRKYDVPLTDHDGTPLGVTERGRLYARSILLHEPVRGLTPHDLASRSLKPA